MAAAKTVAVSPAGFHERVAGLPIVRALRAFWRASRHDTALLLSLAVLSGFVPLALYVQFASVAGAISAPLADGPNIDLGIAVLAVLFVLLQVRDPFVRLFVGRLARRLDASLQRRVIAASITPRTVDHLATDTFHRAGKAARDWETSAHPPAAAAWAIQNFTTNGLVGIGSALLVFQFAWWAPLLLGAGFLLLGVWGSRFREGPGVARVRGDTALRRATYLRDLTFNAGAGREARLFGIGPWLRARSDEQWRDAMRRVWAARTDTWPVALATLIVLVGSHLLVFGLIAQAMLDGRVDVAQAALYIQGASGLVNLWMPWTIVALRESTAPLPLVDALPRPHPAPPRPPTSTADPKPEPGVSSELDPTVRDGPASPDGLPRRSIVLRGLTFAYPGRREPILDGFDLELRAGESVAIVGPNGAGKTTLVKLLCGLLDPTGGTIEIDGRDLAAFDRALWQARVAAIFQDFVRYPFSARDNIVLGRPATHGAAIDRAIDRSRAAEVLAQLPDGMMTPLARDFGGVDLSGGQWQRIALARAMYAVERGAGVLVLDEPTAQLDVRAEAELFDRFLDMTAGLTTVLISHRFSSVRHADRIVVLDGGRVVEDGSHRTLMAGPTRYAELFRLQARHFEAADA